MAFGLAAAACGGGETTTTTAAAPTTAAPAVTEAAVTEETTGRSPDEPIRIALVAPSASNDLAFTQSMVDSLGRLAQDYEIDLDVTDGTFIIEDAAVAIRSYAEDGYDIVLAHGSNTAGPSPRSPPTSPTPCSPGGPAATPSASATSTPTAWPRIRGAT